MDSDSEVTVGKKLSEIFNSGITLFDEIEKTDLPYNSLEFQDKVKRSIGHFEDATRLVSLGGIFSANEFVEELPTEHLRYLLLPYYLGQLSTKLLNTKRDEALKFSDIYYKDFLKRCEDYEILQHKESNKSSEKSESLAGGDDQLRELVQAASQRNNKLEQYRKQKELEQLIENLKITVKSDHVDDEIKRDFYLKTINYCILKVNDELSSIEQELKILEFSKGLPAHASTDENDGPSRRGKRPHNHEQKQFKPIIITKDVAQKAVFGMGYPSLPVMTVAEFYEQRVREGIFPNAEKVKQINAEMLAKQQGLTASDEDKEEEEKAREEILVEDDDEENLARLRAKDEYKDVVRRGDGNRHNRS